MLTPEQSRAARGLLDWSQTELAKRANLSESTIRDFEKGRRVPSPNNLAAIAAAFQQSGIALIGDAQASQKGGVGVRLQIPTELGVITKQIEALDQRIAAAKLEISAMMQLANSHPTIGNDSDFMDRLIGMEEHLSQLIGLRRETMNIYNNIEKSI